MYPVDPQTIERYVRPAAARQIEAAPRGLGGERREPAGRSGSQNQAYAPRCGRQHRRRKGVIIAPEPMTSNVEPGRIDTEVEAGKKR